MGGLNDFQVLAELQPVEITPPSTIPIKYNKEVEAASHGKYWGNSKNIKYYHEKQAKEKKKGSMEITAFFSPVPAPTPSVNSQQDELSSFEEEVLKNTYYSMTIKKVYEKLTLITSPIMNAKEDAERAMQDYELRKHIGVHTYFKEIIGGKGAIEAS
ncbi:hypothetical protein INT45_008737 [Circinella minor]|uniref:Uncharacterized protein n=1 Tax=Circinella minor TaxID=1195481 RepID=A0A8H7RP83_9FUNG|nr:hypothetical protein INT45_008737 [Circinella minor]